MKLALFQSFSGELEKDIHDVMMVVVEVTETVVGTRSVVVSVVVVGTVVGTSSVVEKTVVIREVSVVLGSRQTQATRLPGFNLLTNMWS